MKKKNEVTSLMSHFPQDAVPLLEIKAKDVLDKLGADATRKVVCDVFSGVNIRTATEELTRRRLALLSAALVVFTVRARAEKSNFFSALPDVVHEQYFSKASTRAQRSVLAWLVGLNTKAIQNVLRSDNIAWQQYLETFSAALNSVREEVTTRYGPLTGSLAIGRDALNLDWESMLHIATSIGTQTLAIRGAEKSLYGKLFEKLILGAALHALGFKFVESLSSAKELRRVFTLSTTEKRESDATAYVRPGTLVRFDIGFIGPGNSEISLDKVTRFERQADLYGKKWTASTIIIIDRIGAGSKLVELARDMGGHIIQMSASFWLRHLARVLAETTGYKTPVCDLQDEELVEFMQRSVADAPFERFMKAAAASASNVSAEDLLA